MKKQTGFTLVEIAIVLVIIGLLLGGVLKGQEIIKNAKIKNVENATNGVATALYTYQDRYRVLPGDDKGAATRFASAPTAGDGDAKIEGDFKSSTGETGLFWLHLRNAGLVAGPVDTTNGVIPPTNAFNGLTGVSTDTADTAGTKSIAKITGIFVGFTQIPGDIAVILESRADDGKSQLGTIQSSLAGDYAVTGTTPTGTAATMHEIYFAL